MHHYPRYGKVEDFSAELSDLDRIQVEDKDIF